MEPGIYRGMDMTDYIALPYMSASRLEMLRRSPLQYRYSLTQPPEPTLATERGTAVHMAILEPERFESFYVIAEPCVAVLKTGKRQGEKCGNPGLFLKDMGWVCGQHVRDSGPFLDFSGEVITPQVRDAVLGMRDSIMTHPRASTLFEGKGDFEATIVFDDPETGIRCKCRPDRLVERAGMYVALKSTRDAAEWAFPRDAENRGYFRGLAFYRRGLKAAGWPYASTAVVAVESTAPHDLIAYLAEEQDIDSADIEVSRLLRRFQDCERENYWPGYAPEFLTLRRPAWAIAREEAA